VDCPRCRTANEPDRQFCGECGAPLTIECGRCGFANRPPAKFCGGCGDKLAAGPPAKERAVAPAGGERRQVAVLFADLSGFTRLSAELDAEEVHRLLGHFFEAADAAIERFGGTIDKHIGDAVMAIFGAPVAHDNDPRRAVHAAQEIHRVVGDLETTLGRAMPVHVGIASGEVVASGTGSSRHSEYTVTGEAVNLAARLNDLAAAGETLVSESIHAAVADEVESEARGATAVAGMPEPVGVWCIRAVGAARRVPRGR